MVRSFAVRLHLWQRLARALPPSERLTATTRDGQRLALWRVRPSGVCQGAALLLHGLSANRFVFHWPGRSIAEYLAAAGYDAYVGELRGAGSLSTALEPGGLKSREGGPFQARAASLRTPLLMIAASDDRQCPLAALEATAQATKAKVVRFGSRYGHRVEYGHLDLLLGRHTPEEVWPAVLHWLGQEHER